MAKIIVFFDGICNLCNGSVDFLIQRDQNAKLKFSSLQGETAKEFIPDLDREKMRTIVVWNDGEILRESEAVLFLLHHLGGIWRLMAWLGRMVPRNFRDLTYRLVSRNRYRWFGQRSSCRMPSQDEKSRFLD